MTDPSSRLGEIRARLAAAPGPWLAVDLPWSSQTRVFTEPYDPDESVSIAQANAKCDAEFIAAAPADVGWLLEHVEQLQRAAGVGEQQGGQDG